MKLSYSLALLVILLVVGAVIFNWLEKSSDNQPTLRRIVDCRPEILDDSVLDLAATTTLIGANIIFDRVPLADSTKEQLSGLNVQIDEGSQLFEIDSTFYAAIPTASLCELSKIPSIKSIYVPVLGAEETKQTNNETP